MTATMPEVRAQLRHVSDDGLAAFYVAASEDAERRAALREARRRDNADAARRRSRARHAEWEQTAYANYLAAEAYCRGELVNRRRAGSVANAWPELWMGSEERARRLASEELLSFWDYQQARPPGPNQWQQQQAAGISAADAEYLDGIGAAWDAPTVRPCTVKVNGQRVAAWWRIAGGAASLHATRGEAEGAR